MKSDHIRRGDAVEVSCFWYAGNMTVLGGKIKKGKAKQTWGVNSVHDL